MVNVEAPPALRRASNMADVARVAGVSHQTVSRVLNGSPSVRPETRERVLAAIAKSGYRRNSAARALVTRRSETLGVVSYGTTLYGPASMLSAIEEAARQAGYFITVASVQSGEVELLARAIERLADQSVDGLAIIAPLAHAEPELSDLPADLPVVVLESGVVRDSPALTVDQVGGARLATQHLLEQGASTVWHVAGPEGWSDVIARERGWREVLEQAGRAVPPVTHGDWSPASGYAAGRRLAARDDVDAVFVSNDHMALGVLRAMAEAGRRVPEDVLVVGFDDVPEAAYYNPPLTTVRQDFAELGRRGMELLLEQVRRPAGAPVRVAPERSTLPVELVVRESTSRR